MEKGWESWKRGGKCWKRSGKAGKGVETTGKGVETHWASSSNFNFSHSTSVYFGTSFAKVHEICM